VFIVVQQNEEFHIADNYVRIFSESLFRSRQIIDSQSLLDEERIAHF